MFKNSKEAKTESVYCRKCQVFEFLVQILFCLKGQSLSCVANLVTLIQLVIFISLELGQILKTDCLMSFLMLCQMHLHQNENRENNFFVFSVVILFVELN